MSSPAPKRVYRAACPGCGAPVDFFSAQSTHAVCAYCQSTVMRDAATLARVGKMAELFDDHSPLQLMASGRYQGVGFTLIGRLQYRYGSTGAETPEDAGFWTEWVALADDGQTWFLCEDNGAYILAKPVDWDLPKVAASTYRLGSSHPLNRTPFSVTSNRPVSLSSAAGEVPNMPTAGQSFEWVEMRSPDEQVLTLDYSPTLTARPPSASLGRSVQLADLALSGLKSESLSEKKGRQLACPHCGGQVVVRLDQSKSISCQQCNALIDLSQGDGAALRASIQDEPIHPVIAVGSVGVLQGQSWQVVGYQHRTGKSPADPDETFGWEEYLLYDPLKGFQFLVESQDGWSLVKPATGVPQGQAGQVRLQYLGKSYLLKESYLATTDYVVGEFYWVVKRDQATYNYDYVKDQYLLNAEATGSEIVWSFGGPITAKTVAKAFGIAEPAAFVAKEDTQVLSDLFDGINRDSWTVWILVICSVIFVLVRCSDDCDPRVENCYRSGGGSYGGFSTGGGHK